MCGHESRRQRTGMPHQQRNERAHSTRLKQRDADSPVAVCVCQDSQGAQPGPADHRVTPAVTRLWKNRTCDIGIQLAVGVTEALRVVRLLPSVSAQTNSLAKMALKQS